MMDDWGVKTGNDGKIGRINKYKFLFCMYEAGYIKFGTNEKEEIYFVFTEDYKKMMANKD